MLCLLLAVPWVHTRTQDLSLGGGGPGQLTENGSYNVFFSLNAFSMFSATRVDTMHIACLL